MRSIWKGSISFGLVSIPIKVVSATENHSVSFHQVHTADGGRIRYRKVCELDGEEVAREEIGRGFDTDEGNTVLLTDEDMAALPLPTARTVEILGFVPAEEIDPIQLDRSYYLAADGTRADKPYVLLREALNRSGKVAVAKLAMRGRESLGMLRVYDDALALHTMLWPDEIRSVSGVAPEERVTVRDAELDMADTLMDTLGDLDWNELHDEYREALERLVEAKAQGGGLETGAEEGRKEAAGSGKLVDLMAVLERSVQEAKGSGGEGGEATVHELSERRTGTSGSGSGSRKKAAKKAAKKTAGRKAPAKKSASGGPGSGSGPGGSAKKSTAKTAAKKTAAKKTAATKTAKKTAPKKAAARKTASKSTRTRKSA